MNERLRLFADLVASVSLVDVLIFSVSLAVGTVLSNIFSSIFGLDRD